MVFYRKVLKTMLNTASLTTDSKRWDLIHQKIHHQHTDASSFAEEVESVIPRGCMVCELGGGTGSDALHFLRKGHSVILFDISEFALKVAQGRVKKEGFSEHLVVQQIDFGLHALPLKDNSIDVAYSRISLNYFGNRHTVRIFADIYRSLKIGGSAYLTFKSPEDKKEMERLALNAVIYEPGVYIEAGQLRSRFTIPQLEEILKKAGITNFKVDHYVESLGRHVTGVEQLLYQNRIVFTKTS